MKGKKVRGIHLCLSSILEMDLKHHEQLLNEFALAVLQHSVCATMLRCVAGIQIFFLPILRVFIFSKVIRTCSPPQFGFIFTCFFVGIFSLLFLSLVNLFHTEHNYTPYSCFLKNTFGVLMSISSENDSFF